MKIASFYNKEWEKEYLTKKLEGHEVVYYDDTLQDHTDLKDDSVDVLSVFVKSPVSAKEMDQFPNLKMIATRSTGFDHIDMEEANKRGVIVSNVPTYGENTVAEYAFAIILALSRRVYESYDRVLKIGSFSPEGLDGFDLKDKTIGVVGTGHIGKYSIKMAKGFSMNVIAFDVRHDEAAARELGFTYVEFDELLAQSDIITLHAPYNEHTHHMINDGNVGKIKKGAYLINTARGGLVETSALIKALESGSLAGAGLDVVEEEGYMLDDIGLLMDNHPNPESLRTLLANQYLIDHPRVMIMPHNAFNTREAVERILTTTAENIFSFTNGNPINMVGGK